MGFSGFRRVCLRQRRTTSYWTLTFGLPSVAVLGNRSANHGTSGKGFPLNTGAGGPDRKRIFFGSSLAGLVKTGRDKIG